MRHLLFISLILFALPLMTEAQEAGVEISPRIIDEKVLPGDLLKYEINIKNVSESKQNLYAVVQDLSGTSGEVEYLSTNDLDKDVSITRWLEFKRGVIELMPGEEINIPLKIDVSSTAKSGKRYARIALPNGSNRPTAQENMSSRSYAQVLINISVEENIVEKAQVKGFSTKSNIYINPPVTLSINLDNSGNRPITPKGSIYVYNRRDEQVAVIDANAEAEAIAPGEAWAKEIDWSEIRGMGKFKAKLELEYGEVDKRDLQDAVFFWYLPWKFLLVFFSAFFVFLALMMTFLFRKSHLRHSLQHQSSQRHSYNYQKIGVHEEGETEGTLDLRKK